MTTKERVSFAYPKLEKQFAAHVNKWSGCTACQLSRGRSKVVLYRGYIPCDILFVGEAPGESEDAIGYPFIGPAGMLLDSLWREASHEAGGTYSRGVTNIVSCWPHNPDELGSGLPRPPSKDEAKACSGRLRELYELADPKAVVCLGNVAERYFLKGVVPKTHVRAYHLLHPSAILRTDNPSSQSLQEKKWVLSLATILKGLEGVK